MQLDRSVQTVRDGLPSTSTPASSLRPLGRWQGRGSMQRVGTMAPDRPITSSARQRNFSSFQDMEERLARSLEAMRGQMEPRPSAQKQRFPAEPDVVQREEEYHPSRGWRPQAHHPSRAELWQAIRLEAWEDAAKEPALASFLYSTILSHTSMEKTLAFLLSNKLANRSTLLEGVQLMGLFQQAYDSDPRIMDAAMADMLAVKDRDPACEQYSQCMLYFKGYQAVQTQRVAHWLWKQGRQSLALALQSRCSELFHVDIHPGAQIGRGVLLDHATGVVIGETAVVGDNVSMLHHVSLGGSGTGKGTRHPTIGHGVLLGAGVTVLGPVFVGEGSKVGAGSVVVSDLPSHSVAVGVPARVIKRDVIKEPIQDMDQCLDYVLDYEI